MKDILISKLTITETWHRPSQFKKISDALPILCADRNYWGLNEVLHTGCDQAKIDFMSAYPDANWWSSTHHVQISTVDPTADEEPDGSRPVRFRTMEQTNVTDANLQKDLLLEYERKFQEQVLRVRVHQVLSRQEDFNHDLIWTMWWSNPDQHFFWSKLYRGPQCRMAFCFIGDDGGLSYESYNK